MKQQLVVVGNGMAGVACVEQILKYAPQFEITIFGDETHVNYNRILLSSVLAGEKAADEIALNPLEWYQRQQHPPARRRPRHGVDPLREDRHREDGSRHLVRHAAASPPAARRSCRRSTASTRTASSCSARSTTRARLLERSRPGVKAVVIGGGLLGLEAARGLQVQGCDVTVVHLMDR